MVSGALFYIGREMISVRYLFYVIAKFNIITNQLLLRYHIYILSHARANVKKILRRMVKAIIYLNKLIIEILGVKNSNSR